MSRRKATITLTDPQALRALAHPARQRLVKELFSGRVLTATEAAELVGLTPSAVSHHLRALEKWGLARRAPGTEDRRERPWEATARSLNLKSSSDAASRAAISIVIGQQLDEVHRDVDNLMRHGAAPWTEGFRGLSRDDLWLTAEEVKELTQTLEARIEQYSKGRSATRHPRGTRRASFTWSLIPSEQPAEQKA